MVYGGLRYKIDSPKSPIWLTLHSTTGSLCNRTFEIEVLRQWCPSSMVLSVGTDHG